MASLKRKTELLEAINKEIKIRKDYLKHDVIDTIYFGGGTPSLLSVEELQEIFSLLHKTFQISQKAEITLEANPDDLTIQKIRELKQTEINRLSIGIQSFGYNDLLYLNRIHTAEQCIKSVQASQDAGFTNMSIDLIFGTPTLTNTGWEKNLHKFISLNVPHLSAYSLTVEPKTPLELNIRKGKQQNVDEEKQVNQFNILCDFADQNKMKHYEISNLCFGNSFSIHNTNYWFGKKYLGLGPSAHSFDGRNRHWNHSSINKYIEILNNDDLPSEEESLSTDQSFNEYIMLRLRTQWGINILDLTSIFGEKYQNHYLKEVRPFIDQKFFKLVNNSYILTRKGKLFADGIASKLFV